MRYIAFVHKDKDRVFGASFPDFPGCVCVGRTLETALHNAGEALALHAEACQENGRELPVPRTADQIESHAQSDTKLVLWRRGATLAYIPLIWDKGSPRRINVSLDCGLLQAIDEAAKSRSMTRSAFLSSAARKEIEGNLAAP